MGRIRLIITIAMAALMLCGCGGGGGAVSQSSDSVSAAISTSGGSLTTPSGDTTLSIPAGALDSETTITIGLCSRETPPGNLVGVYEFSPDGQTFNFPVTISIRYDPDSIPEGMDPSELRLAYLSGNGTWEIIPGSTVDTINHIISGQTSHFSTYSMVSEHKLAFGTEIVGFNSVNVFSNGSEIYLSHENNSYNGYATGMKWRSEEYVNRFYWQVYGKQIRIEGQNAKDYYNHATERGLVAYANDGSESPQEGDIIVSEYGEYGHAAIVKEVYASKIYVTQQNWCNNEHDSTYHLLRSGNHVDPFGGKKSQYTVRGWLRSGTAPTYSISGKVSGDVLSGVTITSSAAGSPSTTTDAGGNFSFSNVVNGSYTLTASLAGYTFSPSSTVVTVSGANKTGIDFTATANISPTYSISGAVSGAVLSGVTITLSGDASASTITDDGGNYSFSNLANGSYTSTPSAAGYTFSPAGINLTVNNANVTGQNFTATATVETWGQKADLGGMARTGVVGFSIGSKGYIGTGILELGYGYTKEFWEYDPAANTWTQKADFGGTARHRAVGFSIGSMGYIGTGMDASSPYYKKDFWEYDPAANAWTQKADFGGTARMDAVGFSIGSKGYIGTGYNVDTVYKDFWEYDPSANAWTQKADFGGTARYGAAGFSIGSKGYIGTGLIEGAVTKDFWEYDPSANSWTQKADFGGAGRKWAVGFSIGTRGYIGTGNPGWFGLAYLKDFWGYDPASNSWTQKADFGDVARFKAVGFSIGTKGYVGTGDYVPTNSYKKDFWEYQP